MTVLVSIETVLLVLLVVLVAGLLRSHAEILRRLGPTPPDGEEQWRHDPSVPAPRQRAGVREANDIVGMTPPGDAVQIGLGADAEPTLLAFLSSGCSVCERFWVTCAPDGGPRPRRALAHEPPLARVAPLAHRRCPPMTAVLRKAAMPGATYGGTQSVNAIAGTRNEG